MGETLETKLDLENSKSLLPKPIKELITLIFDIGNRTLLIVNSLNAGQIGVTHITNEIKIWNINYLSCINQAINVLVSLF